MSSDQLSLKVNTPKSPSYKGAQDAKELENFLFDTIQYFKMTQSQIRRL